MIKKIITLFLLIALSACKKNITPSPLENIKTSITGIWGLTGFSVGHTQTIYCNGAQPTTTYFYYGGDDYLDSTLLTLALMADGNIYSNIPTLHSNTDKGWQLINTEKLGINGRIATIGTLTKDRLQLTLEDSVVVDYAMNCRNERTYLKKYYLKRL